MHKIFRKRSMKINSAHHQAVGNLAPMLRATAHTRDGIVEAIELNEAEAQTGPFLLGMQFHPERLWERYPNFSSRSAFISLPPRSDARSVCAGDHYWRSIHRCISHATVAAKIHRRHIRESSRRPRYPRMVRSRDKHQSPAAVRVSASAALPISCTLSTR